METLKIGKIELGLPDRIVMAHWNKIMPIQKKVESGKLTEIESIIELLQILNANNVVNTTLKDEILNMELPDFEKIATFIWEFLWKGSSKKK